MKKYITSVFILFLLIPNLVFATQENDKEKIQTLITQVQILVAETARLQNKLLEHQSGVLKNISTNEIDKSISSSIEWFKHAQEENGHFRYEYVPYENKYLEDDNIVRQAGAMYALGEVLRRDVNNVYDVKKNIEKAASYFEKLSRSDEYKGKKIKCIVSKEGGNTCILGTTSLVVVSLIDLVERYPDLNYKYGDIISDYIEYILSTKKEKTGFRNYYYINSKKQNDRESSFSTGEAMLALSRYYSFNPTNEVKEVIEETFKYMQNEMPFDFGLYLWAMTAIKELQQNNPQDEYVSYVRAYTDWRMTNFKRHKGSTHNMCAYVEGVANAYSVLDSTSKEKEKYLRDINYWLSKSIKLQVTNKDINKLVYSNGRASFASLKEKNKAIGGFLTGENELTQRIDYTQHCLNSFVQKKIDIDNSSFVLR